MLIIFGGLPGTGKSTLSSALARHTGAFYLRIDTIEQALRHSGSVVDGPAGYLVAYDVALENLRLGGSVIADSVNPLNRTRQAWREVALQAEVPFIEIEVICSNAAEHRARVESRQPTVPGLQLPTWQQVVEREYDWWNELHIVIDTADDSPEQSLARLLDAIEKVSRGKRNEAGS